MCIRDSTYLTEFASFGVKSTGSTNNNNAFNWLKNKYISFGYDASQISENAFTYGGNTTKNLILTKTGTLYPNTFVIVCGHYDTIAAVSYTPLDVYKSQVLRRWRNSAI